jgi:hypothetical protein
MELGGSLKLVLLYAIWMSTSAETDGTSDVTKINTFLVQAMIEQYGNNGFMSNDNFHEFVNAFGEKTSTDLNITRVFRYKLLNDEADIGLDHELDEEGMVDDTVISYDRINCRNHGNWTACVMYLKREVSLKTLFLANKLVLYA